MVASVGVGKKGGPGRGRGEESGFGRGEREGVTPLNFC